MAAYSSSCQVEGRGIFCRKMSERCRSTQRAFRLDDDYAAAETSLAGRANCSGPRIARTLIRECYASWALNEYQSPAETQPESLVLSFPLVQGIAGHKDMQSKSNECEITAARDKCTWTDGTEPRRPPAAPARSATRARLKSVTRKHWAEPCCQCSKRPTGAQCSPCGA